MSEKSPQNYANHAKLVPPYHYGITAILLVHLVRSFWKLGDGVLSGAFTFDLLMNALLALAFVGMFLYLRLFPLAAQDRVIRQEMRLRLKEILPADLFARVEELRRGQWVALRFAGDGEMPDLVRAALDERLSGTEIKKRVKDWQPDYFRF